MKVNSETLRLRRRATKEEMDGLRCLPAGQQPTIEKAKGLLSRQRFYLNGLALNRAKFTTYSRHYTTHTVLCKIAAVVQPLLRPGDTFVDFSCGQNTFAPLLMDPANGRDRLRSVAVDIISPVERTDGFVCKSWLLVDPTHLPPGELVIGVNPPFGHENRKAIEFVEHARCAQPRRASSPFFSPASHPAPRMHCLPQAHLHTLPTTHTPGQTAGVDLPRDQLPPDWLRARPPRRAHVPRRRVLRAGLRVFQHDQRAPRQPDTARVQARE